MFKSFLNFTSVNLGDSGQKEGALDPDLNS